MKVRWCIAFEPVPLSLTMKSSIPSVIQDAMMEVEEQVAAQAPTSVEKVKVIVTVMLIVLAV